MKISKLGENGVYKNILFQFSPLFISVKDKIM